MSKAIAMCLEKGTSKHDEIVFVLNLFDGVTGKDLYLTQFFSKQLVDWLRESITHDLSCDLFADYENALENGEKQARLVGELRKKYQELERTLIEERDANVEEVQRYRNSAKIKEDYERTMREEVCQKNNQIMELKLALEEEKSKVVDLKAKLYDLIVG